MLANSSGTNDVLNEQANMAYMQYHPSWIHATANEIRIELSC